jgi:hypothetical protein
MMNMKKIMQVILLYGRLGSQKMERIFGRKNLL